MSLLSDVKPFSLRSSACFVQILLTLASVTVASAADPAYLEELIQRARAHRLSEHREWRLLLHYKRNRISSGGRSLVDSTPFFNAPNGKHDPAAELEATLASFFSRELLADRQELPQCAFIARYQWLKHHLEFDPQRLPEQPCPRYHAWIAELDPQGITLIFPVAYLNNPPSMFGHTLLRVDSTTHTDRTRLLDFSVNFAAQADEERGIGYVFKGLFGGYPGRFFVSHYYRKVKEYGDIENRDIWEYRLTLTPAETRRLLMHLWELHTAHFDYFFSHENCSYQLLSLIEVARPSLHLTDAFNWWAIPADTVRAVTAAPGLLETVRYRPSRSTILRHRVQGMPAHLQKLARRFADNKITAENLDALALAPIAQARTLELALDYLAYRKVAEDELSAVQEERTLALLKMRSQLDVPDQLPQIRVPKVRPDQGHKTSRLGLVYGIDDDTQFIGLQYRHSYHDLLDPTGGFPAGVQLEFLHAELRYHPRKGQVNLERFRLLDILSVPARDRFLKPFSWKVGIGADRKRFANHDRELVGEATGGFGVSYRLSARSMIYAFVEGTLGLSGRFNQSVAIALGPSASFIWDLSRHWRVSLAGHFLQYVQGMADYSYRIGLYQRLHLTKQSALTIDIIRRRDFGHAFTTASLSWRFYF